MAYIAASSLGLPEVKSVNPAAPAETVIAKLLSGDKRIDPLLDGPEFRFNTGSPVGTAVTVTYSFPDTMPTTYVGEDAKDWKTFNAEQRAATREILALLQKQVNITFQEVTESSDSTGTMRFSNNNQGVSAGYAIFPNSNQNPQDADTWIAIGYDTNVVKGAYAWTTLVHEIGHAVGLSHPGNYNAGEVKTSDAVGNYLGVKEDTFYNTIMSYRQSAQSINDTWFQPYDILALRYLYGTNAYATGDTVYKYTDASGLWVDNIIDDGGSDTIDLSALTVGAGLDLTPGAFSNVGKISSGENAQGNLTISFDAVIEKVIGTSLPDNILGNQANNTLTGGGGNDVLNGAAGTDTAVFSGKLSDYSINYNRALGTASITDKRTVGDGADSLKSIEKLQFSDKTFELINPPRTEPAVFAKSQSFLFDAAFYLLKNPDLVPTVNLTTAYDNFKAVGAAKGAAPNSWFDAVYYANKWADLKSLNLDAATLFAHYNLYGVWEGRSAGPVFDKYDGNRYLADNPDVAGYVDGNLKDFLGSRSNGAIAHFVIYGAAEGRVAYDTDGKPLDLAILIGVGP